MGIACALMIYLWVEDELSFDKFHEKGSRLFQVMQNLQDAGSIATIEYTPHPLAMALVDEFPEVEYATTAVLSKWFSNKGVLTFDNRHVKGAAQFISKHYFDIFSCDFIYGHKDQMLTGKYNVAISDEMAMNLFNRTDNLIGKSVDWKLVDSGTDFSGTYVIVGIFKKQPANSSASFDLLLNYELFFEKRPSLQSWGNSDPFTYVTLKEGTDVEQFNAKIAGFLKSKFKDSTGSLFIRKYSDQHLYSEYNNGVQSGGRIEYVKLFSIIAVFLLLVACINFMNLSTAKASRRLKEVGIKKAIGASKRTLILQHLGESLLMSFISLFVAVILVQLLLPAFNVITGKHLVLNFEINLVLSVLSITLFTGFISGSYPAFYISSFSPAAVLKGKFSTSLGELWARKGLVIFQFAISVILMVSVFVVYRQLEYIQTKNLGYDKDNLVYFDISGVRNERVETFLSETEKIPGVVNATTFIHNLAGNHGGYSGLEWDGKDPNKDIDFSNIEVGYDFLEIMGIQLMDGETFSPELASSRQIIFNKIAIERMGLKDPVGKLIKVAGEEKLIVGITENFHFESLHENIKPCFFQVYPSRGNVLIKIEAGKEQRIIDKVQQLYQQFNPDTPFDFKFMDEDYQSLYVSEQRIAVLSRYFGAMAIFISCIGLFGLSSFSAERRSKEIGIRKVLGSSIFNIVILLSSDFTKIVFAAIVIALPISYFIAKQWLDEFAYRISLSWWYFIITGMTALSIAWLTVGVQALKTAHINSAKCLRDE
jgi:ABC-type antimicrobial peptide transport system permease subunit